MPTNRTKRTRGRAGLDYWKLSQLIDGDFLLAGVGYCPAKIKGGSSHYTESDWADVYSQARADWQQHGAAVKAWWSGQTETFTALFASMGGQQRDPSQALWAETEFGEIT